MPGSSVVGRLDTWYDELASYAPMSTVVPAFKPAGPRRAPRWSTVGAVIEPEATAKLKAPASIAGLPARSATVSVGPPLLASVPSNGLLTPTRFPLTPLVNPLVIPPIRLYELAGLRQCPRRRWSYRSRCTVPGGVAGDERVVERGRSGGSIDPAAGAAGCDGVVGDCRADTRSGSRPD